MRKGGAITAAIGVSLALGIASNAAARAVAQSRLGRPIEMSLPLDASTVLWLIPVLLVAGACGYAAASRSKALFLVPLLALPPYAFFTYHGKYDSARALAARAWTASALSEGLPCFASIGIAMVAIPIAFSIASRIESRFPTDDRRGKSNPD